MKDACELAEKLGVKNLLLYHTEDRNLTKRKVLYQEEGTEYYHGEKMTLQDCWVAFEKRYVLIGKLIDIFILVKLPSVASSFQPCTRHKT